MDAIVLRNVSKEFRKKTIRREYTTLKSELVDFLKRTRRPEGPVAVTPALRDVSLTVPRGADESLTPRMSWRAADGSVLRVVARP